MHTAEDFIQVFSPGNSKSVLDKFWSDAKTQALRHTRSEGLGDLIAQQRPNESQFIRDYRLANIRAITREGVIKFNDKASRIINASNYSLNNVSDSLSDWLEGNRFELGNGESVSLTEWFSRFVLPCSFEDPNAVVVAFPFNGDNPSIRPAAPIQEGGLPDNVQVSITPKLIASDRIVHIDGNIIAWEKLEKVPIEIGTRVKEYPAFFIVDKVGFYEYIPTGVRSVKGKRVIIYELFPWYFHDSGDQLTNELPICLLGGTVTKVEDDGEYYTYNESYLKPYYELADEAMTTFSDYQAVKVRTAYPIKVILKRPCEDCDGNGMVKGRSKKGDIYNHACNTCEGNGFIKGLSPFKDIVLDDGSGLHAKNTSNRKPVEYISPPLDVLSFLNDDWRQLLKDAKRSINLDLLEDTAESGEAKKQRLQDLQDMLGKIGGNLFDTLECFLWYTENLLTPNRDNRQKPKVVRPVSFEIKNENDLKEEVKEAPMADRLSSFLSYVRKKYKGDEVTIRIKELAVKYAPLLLLDDPKELQIRLAFGYSDRDIVKADRSEAMLMQMVSEGIDLQAMTMGEVFALLDQRLEPFLPPRALPILPPDA